MNETATFVGPDSEWGGTRIEFWEVDGIGTPDFLNAVATGAGRVDVQRIEWQIEHRYRFQVDAEVFKKTMRQLVQANVLGIRAEAADQVAANERRSVRIVLVNAQAVAKSVEIARSRDEPAFRRSRDAIRDLVRPDLHGAQPLWSRGPGPTDTSFP